MGLGFSFAKKEFEAFGVDVGVEILWVQVLTYERAGNYGASSTVARGFRQLYVNLTYSIQAQSPSLFTCLHP